MGLIILALLLFFIPGSVIPLVLTRRERNAIISLACASLGSLVTLGSGIYYLFNPMKEGIDIGTFPQLVDGFPGFSANFFADRLAALFLILVGGLSLAAILRMHDGLHEISERYWTAAVFNLFVLTTTLTILANTVYFYLFTLEGIVLTYAYLVLFQHNQSLEREDLPAETMEAAKTAFKTYLIFEHAGGLLLAVALLALSAYTPQASTAVECAKWNGQGVIPALGFRFDVIRCAAQRGDWLTGPAAGLVFLLSLIGLGIKTGMFPAHVWVPLVNPYSPTSAQAIMSGVVLSVSGIYGMYRIFFEFFGPGELWWGLLVLLLAAVTALIGVFNALIGRDLRVVLSAHSVANGGIILTGIGLALIYRWAAVYVRLPYGPFAQSYSGGMVNAIADSFQVVEMLALIASLYQIINHAVYKSLLLFSTSVIEDCTGVTALDRLGGLMKRYPWVSAAFLVGVVSACSFPPFNGFISQWLTLQSLFGGMNLFLPGMPPRVILLVGLTMSLLCLALAFGISTVAFVRIAGEALLGAPRDPGVAQRAKPVRVTWRIRLVLTTLAVLCLLLGLFPGTVAHGLGRLAHDSLRTSQGDPIYPGWINLAFQLDAYRVVIGGTNGRPVSAEKVINGYQSRLSGRFLWGTAGMLGMPLVVILGLRVLKWGRKYRLERGQAWNGGVPFKPEIMQYTSSAFSSMLWMPFEEGKIRAFFQRGAPGTAAAGYLPTSERVTERRAVLGLFRQFYDTLIRLTVSGAQVIGDRLQSGNIRLYLLYIFLCFGVALGIIIMNSPVR